jgi:hypothetical protein
MAAKNCGMPLKPGTPLRCVISAGWLRSIKSNGVPVKLFSAFGKALSLTAQVWMETLFFAVFMIPIFWGGLEVAARGGDPRILQFALMIPQALFTGFSAVVLYQAFDNSQNGTEVELPMERLLGLTVSITIATFLVNVIVSIGSIFCLIPGLFAMTGLYLTQITIFKEDAQVLDSLYQSWSKTEGHRLEIFSLLIIVGLAASVLAIPIFAGLLLYLYGSQLTAAGSASDAFLAKIGMAVIFGLVGAFVLSFSRALEYSVYTEISPNLDRWMRPAMDSRAPAGGVTEPAGEADPADPAAPAEPLRERVAPPMRAPITVDQDIVFGKDANDDDNDKGW